MRALQLPIEAWLADFGDHGISSILFLSVRGSLFCALNVTIAKDIQSP
jgi:hypothetical protein